MLGEQASSALDSLSKKRARDRRAQHNLRKKREAHINTLYQRITDLETEVQSLREGLYGLRRENELLKSRQSSISPHLSDWGDPLLSQVASFPCDTSTSNTVDADPRMVPTLETSSSQSSVHVHSTESTQTRPQIMQDLTSSPRWKIMPVHVDGDIMTDLTCLWVNKPEIVCGSPEFPRPIDLLYGSKTNYLAHVVSSATRRWPFRDPERLAAGWLTYRLLRWISQPSERRFALLQGFQAPVSEQLCSPHPYYVDFVMWPGLRANMVKYQHIYDPHDVVGMLTCCIKVRWPWNEPILEPGDDGELVLRPDFRDMFTNISGWGLTKEFFERFPLLCQDLGDASIRYDFA